MANMANVTYVIEGTQSTLSQIYEAITSAMDDNNRHWEEYQACINLGFTKQEIEDKRLRGEISEKPQLNDKVMKFWAEECWGLQDFEQLLMQKFQDIKIYWNVEESGCGVFCTNDKEGKYFPERYWVDVHYNDLYLSEYFQTEETIYEWLSTITKGKVGCLEDVENFNDNCESSEEYNDDFIYIHKFEVLASNDE